MVYHSPQSIVSDRETKFLFHFLQTLWERFGTKMNFSTTCHPQSNGQTKVVNRSLGNLLRTLVGNNPKRWDQCLPQTEFAFNNMLNRSTGVSPFIAAYGHQLIKAVDISSVTSTQPVGKRYLTIMWLMAWLSIHILQFPFFLGTRSAGTAQGLTLGLIKLLISNCSTVFEEYQPSLDLAYNVLNWAMMLLGSDQCNGLLFCWG